VVAQGLDAPAGTTPPPILVAPVVVKLVAQTTQVALALAILGKVITVV
jgi:hypothetical protein